MSTPDIKSGGEEAAACFHQSHQRTASHVVTRSSQAPSHHADRPQSAKWETKAKQVQVYPIALFWDSLLSLPALLLAARHQATRRREPSSSPDAPTPVGYRQQQGRKDRELNRLKHTQQPPTPLAYMCAVWPLLCVDTLP